MHLDILVDRMRREFNVEANIGKPQVFPIVSASRRAVKSKASSFVSLVVVVSLVIRWIRFAPADGGQEGLQFLNEVVGGVVPKEYIPAIQKGIEEQMKNGVVAGYPLIGLKATVFDGSYHDVDSNEMAFEGGCFHGDQATGPRRAVVSCSSRSWR